mmetsp:Transcript_1932/g.2325  ORF Transcript_1932/g.2325 Transcript_1932/m.2325 type:complete len:93 (-) Transcript_1932:82-360(-)
MLLSSPSKVSQNFSLSCVAKNRKNKFDWLVFFINVLFLRFHFLTTKIKEHTKYGLVQRGLFKGLRSERKETFWEKVVTEGGSQRLPQQVLGD